jgi:antitoxin CcdA
MACVYDTTAAKKATNCTVNSDLLARAKEMNINLSATLETALAEVVAETERRQWLEENEAAINHYNKQVRKCGLFSDGLRTF